MTISHPDNTDFSWVRTPALQEVFAAITSAGGQARLVGGCVRDSLLGQPPRIGDTVTTDIDMATTLTPDEVQAVFAERPFRAIPTGIDHGTVTVVRDDLVVEITTLRADLATDGRHATVAFTTDWASDWRRRDFTINALYLCADGRLWDPAKGLEDLRQGRVRFIGDPAARIKEDYLRILRFYRFSARFARSIDQDGHKAAARWKDGLQRVSAERIGHEVTRLLSAPRAAMALSAMEEIALMSARLGPADISAFRWLKTLFAPTDTALLLATAWPGHTDLATGLRLPGRVIRDRADILSLAAQMQTPPPEAAARRLLYHHGEATYRCAVMLATARDYARDGATPFERRWQQLLSLPKRWTVPENPFRAQDFLALGQTPGPRLGNILARVEESWIDAGFPDGDDALADLRHAAIRDVDAADEG